jgi:hypothetical protein
MMAVQVGVAIFDFQINISIRQKITQGLNLLLRMLDQKTVGLMRIPLAVAVGFEPTVGFPPHTLSRRAP